jgi:phosphatidylserine synthase
VIAAFAIRSRRLPPLDGRAPSPWLVGTAALVATSGYWMASGFNESAWREWAGVFAWCLVVAVGVLMISRWSRQRGWNQRHRFALAAGATLTYVWLAFPMAPSDGGTPALDLVSNVVFGSVAVILLLLAGRAAARSAVASPVGQAHT